MFLVPVLKTCSIFPNGQRLYFTVQKNGIQKIFSKKKAVLYIQIKNHKDRTVYILHKP